MGDVTALRGQALSPADVEATVRGASLIDLARHIPASCENELEVWLWFRETFGEEHFPCPRCQLGPGRAMVQYLAAVATDSIFWCCDMCGHRGTRWDLVDYVLHDPVALSDLIHGEVSYVALRVSVGRASSDPRRPGTAGPADTAGVK